MTIKVKLEVYEEGNPFNSAEKYLDFGYEDYHKEVVDLAEKIKQNEKRNI